jgi:predicted O-linked N-acetylglucosamine transferase (SPINDLY family)
MHADDLATLGCSLPEMYVGHNIHTLSHTHSSPSDLLLQVGRRAAARQTTDTREVAGAAGSLYLPLHRLLKLLAKRAESIEPIRRWGVLVKFRESGTSWCCTRRRRCKWAAERPSVCMFCHFHVLVFCVFLKTLLSWNLYIYFFFFFHMSYMNNLFDWKKLYV